ncbi:phosphoenolpyruvate hydrolase family protein [Eubacteriaceae bacterium ES2]|nr:phosphoenolpyruvate hydrolase family protein [Eubacteriaceae bacterium ES2]
MNKREKMLRKINNSLKSNKPVIGVAVGSGLFANQAIKGGADFLLCLSAGRFRVAGLPSIGCMLPFVNSNELIFEFSQKEILPRFKDQSVIAGINATDPNYTHDELLRKVWSQGFSGVTNFPTVGLIDGAFRQYLEENGLGYDQEIAFMQKAVQDKFFTIAFVFSKEQANQMAKIGVDVICAHFGWTRGGEKSGKVFSSVNECLEMAEEIFVEADVINADCLKMIYGGPINTPEDAYYFYKNSLAIGYIGGSSFERIPTELAISETTDKFKNYYKLKQENKHLKKELLRKRGFDEIVGQSNIMQNMYEVINKVANKDVNVLVQGESGTGKELVVKALHFNSKRYLGPLIKVNCAALPPNLLESELFGHEKGAFTGADKRRIGKFELANHGTLFLDEIGDMEIELQSKVLRIIQQQEFERVGGEKTIYVDVRIICATNLDLKNAVAKNHFREDLYYRLNVIEINTPPLRHHLEDIPLLCREFLKEFQAKYQSEEKKLTLDAVDNLMQYNWPGNVRELKHILERAFILSDGRYIRPEDLEIESSMNLENQPQNRSLIDVKVSRQQIECAYILEVLKACQWNRTVAAKQMGISRRTLYNKIQKYHLINGENSI